MKFEIVTLVEFQPKETRIVKHYVHDAWAKKAKEKLTKKNKKLRYKYGLIHQTLEEVAVKENHRGRKFLKVLPENI